MMMMTLGESLGRANAEEMANGEVIGEGGRKRMMLLRWSLGVVAVDATDFKS